MTQTHNIPKDSLIAVTLCLIVINRIVVVASSDNAMPMAQWGFYPARAPVVFFGLFSPSHVNLNHAKTCPVFPHLPRQDLILLKPDSLWWSPPLFRVYKPCSRYILMAHHTHVGHSGPAHSRASLGFY